MSDIPTREQLIGEHEPIRRFGIIDEQGGFREITRWWLGPFRDPPTPYRESLADETVLERTDVEVLAIIGVDEAMIQRADVWLLERFLGAPPLRSSEVAEMLRAALEMTDE